MNESLVEALNSFGTFGSALFVVGLSLWIIWKKIVRPEREASRQDHKQHVETLNKIIENSNRETSKHIEAEKENIKALQGMNNKIELHNQKSSLEHKQILDEIKRNKK